MRKLIILLIILTFFISGCNKYIPGSLLVLNEEKTIFKDICVEKQLAGKVVVLHSKYCGACKVAVPRLKEIEQELNTQFEYYDLAVESDMGKLNQLQIKTQYTPTVVVNCKVYIGTYPKEDYKKFIGDFLNED